MYKKLGRKLVSIAVCMVLLMTLVCNQLGTDVVNAETYTKPTMEVESATAQVGEEFQINVKVYNNVGVAATQLKVGYDMDALLLTDIEVNKECGGSFTVPSWVGDESSTPSGNSVSVLWAGTYNYEVENYTFFTLSFKAKDKLGNYAITVESYGDGIYDEDENDVTFDIVNGSVTIYDIIDDSLTLSGTVTTPVKLAEDSSALSADNVSVDVSWDPALVNNTFAAGTEYTASVTVTGDTGYVLSDDLNIKLDGYEFTKEDDSYVATKTFTATADRVATSIAVTTAPTTIEYTDGDTLKTDGMVVTTTYDDGTTAECTDYTVSYATGNAFVKGNTTATITSGSLTTTVTGLTVNGKTATTGLFTYTEPSLTYSGADQVDAVTSAITVSGTDTSRGAVTYTFKDEDGDTVTTIVDAGTYTVYVALAGGTEYDAMDAKELGTVKVSQKSITETDFAFDLIDKTYTSSQITPSVTSDLVLNQDYTVTYGTNINADEYATIKVEGIGNYSGTISKTFDITPIVLTSGDLSYSGDAPSKIYDGITTCEDITTLGIISGVLDSDKATFSTVSGTAVYNAKDVASADSVIFTPTAITTGNYVIAATETVTITGATITPAAITDTTNKGTADSRINVVTGDGSFTQPTFTGVGTEEVTGDLAYYQDGTKATYAEIVSSLAKLEAGEIATISYVFTGSDNYANQVVEGIIYVKIVDIQFTVEGDAATIDNVVTVVEDNLVYGNQISDMITIIDDVKATVNGIDDDGEGVYALSVGGFLDAGEQTYNVTYTGEINGMQYTNVVVCSGTVTIAPLSLDADDLECSVTSVDKIYDGDTAGSDVVVSVKEDSLVADDTQADVDDLAASVTYNSANVSEAKTAIIKTTEGITEGNYRLNSGLEVAEVSASITPLPISVSIEDIASVDYDGEEKTPVITVSAEDVEDFDEDDYTVKYTNNINAGTTATVTVSDVADNNYDFATTAKTFTINKVDYEGTVAATSEAMYGNTATYSLSELELPEDASFGTISTTGNVEILSTEPTMTGSTLTYTFVNDSDNVGEEVIVTIPVTCNNYNNFDAEVTLKVLAKLEQDGFAFTEDELSKVYGDASFRLVTENVSTTNGVTYGSSDSSILSVDEDGIATIHKVGTVEITATALEDNTYVAATATQTIEIDKYDVLVEVVSEKILVGATMPVFEATMPVLPYGDAIITDVIFDTTAEDTMTAGTYDITASGLVLEKADNYNISYKSATLTIVPEYKVTLDANGGTIENASLTTDVNQNIIGLEDPTGVNNTYAFDGWFTEVEGGTEVTSSTIVGEDLELYAHWSLRDSADSGEISSDVKDVIASYDDVAEFTDEQIAAVNNLVIEVVYDINKEEAKENAETIETLAELEELFLKANSNLSSLNTIPSVSENVEEDDMLPNIPIELQGLALSAFAGVEITEDTTVYLEVEQLESLEDGTLVIDITPKAEEDGVVRDISNEELQTPVTFKLYLNDSITSEYIDVLHILHDGGEETFRVAVQEDELGKYIVITVSQFSEFQLTEVFDVTDGTTDGDTTEDSSVPDTGDHTNVMSVIIVLFISYMGVALLLYKRRMSK